VCFQPIADTTLPVTNNRVDMLDILAFSGLEWVYDRVEDRFGKAAAWIVTLALALTILGIAAAVLVAMF